MNLNKKEFKKWIEALRSGKYEQGDGALQTTKGYCCLGVACEVILQEKHKIFDKKDGAVFLAGTFPSSQSRSPEWLKHINTDVDLKLGAALSGLNDNGMNDFAHQTLTGHQMDTELDSKPFTFDEIADLLELVYIHGAMEESA